MEFAAAIRLVALQRNGHLLRQTKDPARQQPRQQLDGGPMPMVARVSTLGPILDVRSRALSVHDSLRRVRHRPLGARPRMQHGP